MNYQQLLELIDKLDHSSVAYVKYQDVIVAKEVPNSGEPPLRDDRIAQSSMNQSIFSSEEVDVAEDNKTMTDTIASTDVPQEKEGTLLLSPMVGVAYLQPSPEEEPFVQVGDSVKAGDTVLIIEAMKLMTNIKADRDGVITEVLVNNEDVVEYDQPLVRIKQEEDE